MALYKAKSVTQSIKLKKNKEEMFTFFFSWSVVMPPNIRFTVITTYSRTNLKKKMVAKLDTLRLSNLHINHTYIRQCLEITQKVSFFNIVSEASEVYFQRKYILIFEPKINIRIYSCNFCQFWYKKSTSNFLCVNSKQCI